MKHLAFILGTILVTSMATAGVSIYDKDEGLLELTGYEARLMTQLILKKPVTVTDMTYRLTVTTQGRDMRFRPVDVVTGNITCLKDFSYCLVDGSQIRERGDGWLSPAAGFARVFGMGTLMQIADASTAQIFTCAKTYNDISCDFVLR